MEAGFVEITSSAGAGGVVAGTLFTHGIGGSNLYVTSACIVSSETASIDNAPTLIGGCGGNGFPYSDGGCGAGGFIYSNGAAGSFVVGDGYINYSAEVIPETEEQKAERLKREEEARKKRERAEERALALLEDVIGKKAVERYRDTGYHEMLGASGLRYRIRKGTSIQVMKGHFGDEVDYTLCVVHLVDVPPTDTVLTLVLLLKAGASGERIINEKGIKRCVAA